MFQYIGMNRVQVFYKAGSGFYSDAQKQIDLMYSTRGNAGSGGTRWRVDGSAELAEYRNEMTDIFKSLYRRTTIERDEKGQITKFNITKKVNKEIGERVANLASKIANHLEIYDAEQQRVYSTLRQQSKGIRLNQVQRKELNSDLRVGEKAYLRSTGKSNAGNRADESRYRTDEAEDTNIATTINRQLNTQRNAIWHSIQKEGPDAVRGYTQDVVTAIYKRYANTERAASRRRRK